MPCASSCCAMWCIGIAIAWLLLSSTLLFFSWNKVIANLFSFKPAKFWQALLIVLTLAVMCAPKYAKNRHGKGCKGGACPYEQKAVSAVPEEPSPGE